MFTPQTTIGPVAHLVECRLADLGIKSLILAQSHTLVEIDRELFSMGCCKLQVEVCTKDWFST